MFCACMHHNTSDALFSSAKDTLGRQASGQSVEDVAMKKIMKPFSTPVLAKRTYRELKLLKHLRHENVSNFKSRVVACFNVCPIDVVTLCKTSDSH